MRKSVRPSSDLMNHYNEISDQCHRTKEPIIVTHKGREDLVIIGLEDYKDLVGELDLLRALVISC